MKPDELDHVLLQEAEIVPSPGFAKSVMAAVRKEATAPPPIPFPWWLALPGLFACAVAIAWPLVEAFRSPAQKSVSAATSTLSQWMDDVVLLLDKAQMFGAGWVVLTLVLTFVCLKLTWRLAGGRV